MHHWIVSWREAIYEENEAQFGNKHSTFSMEAIPFKFKYAMMSSMCQILSAFYVQHGSNSLQIQEGKVINVSNIGN